MTDIQAQKIKTDFATDFVNNRKELKEMRDYVEQHVLGFGERAFYYLWWDLVSKMPDTFTFLEIGVFRGQTLAVISLIAKLQGKEAHCYGITPLDGTDGHWESDYLKDINDLHDHFDLKRPTIIHGLSTDPEIISEAQTNTFDMVYIDGGHTKEVIESDLTHYPQLANHYLIVDDCANDIEMPWGYFTGIQPVTDAVKKWEKQDTLFTYVDNLVHIKYFKRNGKE